MYKLRVTCHIPRYRIIYSPNDYQLKQVSSTYYLYLLRLLQCMSVTDSQWTDGLRNRSSPCMAIRGSFIWDAKPDLIPPTNKVDICSRQHLDQLWELESTAPSLPIRRCARNFGLPANLTMWIHFAIINGEVPGDVLTPTTWFYFLHLKSGIAQFIFMCNLCYFCCVS